MRRTMHQRKNTFILREQYKSSEHYKKKDHFNLFYQKYLIKVVDTEIDTSFYIDLCEVENQYSNRTMATNIGVFNFLIST
jgi:hypothetical protein